MTGIYIHVPFCRQACRYCDFYFTVSLAYTEGFVTALGRELGMRKDFAGGKEAGTVYFGGGTPSVLSPAQLEQIFSSISEAYDIAPGAEITLEANPDDLNRDYLNALRNLGFNRLSIGIQSFHDRDLTLMRRSHNSSQAREAIALAADEGFNNINIDLIYGVPGMNVHDWARNLEEAMKLPVTHLSAYHLTFEPGTVFSHWKKRGRIREIEDEESQEQYRILREITARHGFNHYEISNFAREGKKSRHNSAYWSGTPYAGYGPGAHSFDGKGRSWNPPSLKKYIDAMQAGESFLEYDQMDEQERYHDFLITTLRTSEGINVSDLHHRFSEAILHHFMKQSDRLIASGDLSADGERYWITPEKWLVADYVIRELMIG